MSKRKVEGEEVKMDMTPMIDVVFQLLIFFLCATKFKAEEGNLKAYLPKDRGQGTGKMTKDNKEVRVKLLWFNNNSDQPSDDFDPRENHVVLKVGNNVLNDVDYYPDPLLYKSLEKGQTPDYASLTELLRNAAAGYSSESAESKGQPVIIDARVHVPYKHVVRVLNCCVEAGIQDISFAKPGDSLP